MTVCLVYMSFSLFLLRAALSQFSVFFYDFTRFMLSLDVNSSFNELDFIEPYESVNSSCNAFSLSSLVVVRPLSFSHCFYSSNCCWCFQPGYSSHSSPFSHFLAFFFARTCQSLEKKDVILTRFTSRFPSPPIYQILTLPFNP